MESVVSPEYKNTLQKKHKASAQWGTNVVGKNFIPFIEKVIEENDVGSALDYGCGKSRLKLSVELDRYDPGIPKRDSIPQDIVYDLIVCLDVLEHVEPTCLDNVLFEIQDRSDLAFMSICTKKAGHILPDGRNAHLIVENREWWMDMLQPRFIILEEFHIPKFSSFGVFCRSK